MQRKFVTSGENTYIPGVLDRILTEYKKAIPRDRRRELDSFKQNVNNVIKSLHDSSSGYVNNYGTIEPTSRLANKILYGRLVHADYSKWKDAGYNPWFSAFLSFLQAQDTFRIYILSMRQQIIDLVDTGIISDFDFQREIKEDNISHRGTITESDE